MVRNFSFVAVSCNDCSIHIIYNLIFQITDEKVLVFTTTVVVSAQCYSTSSVSLYLQNIPFLGCFTILGTFRFCVILTQRKGYFINHMGHVSLSPFPWLLCNLHMLQLASIKKWRKYFFIELAPIWSLQGWRLFTLFQFTDN